MGLLFFPRGGSAQAARYLSRALVAAGWSVELVTGSLGESGDDTHAPTFFAGAGVHYLDYSEAVRVFDSRRKRARCCGADASVVRGSRRRPRCGVGGGARRAAGHLSSVWEEPFRAAGADRADVFHLHHLTPQHEAVRRCWPEGAVVAHLHGTEIKFLEAVNDRAALARSVGTTLAGMPEWVCGPTRPGVPSSTTPQRELLGTTRWEQWAHGEAWRDRLRRQAAAADHLVVVSPADRADRRRAARGRCRAGIGRSQRRRRDQVPSTADDPTGAPRALFRRWLVEDPQGWDETAVAGTVAYREADLERLLGSRRRRHRADLRRALHLRQAGPVAGAGVRPRPPPVPCVRHRWWCGEAIPASGRANTRSRSPGKPVPTGCSSPGGGATTTSPTRSPPATRW